MDSGKVDAENTRHQVFYCATSGGCLVDEPRRHVVLNEILVMNMGNCWLSDDNYWFARPVASMPILHVKTIFEHVGSKAIESFPI